MPRNRSHIRGREWWPTARRLYDQNEKVEEIAHRFNVTPSAVYMAIHRGRNYWKPRIEFMDVVEAFFVFPEMGVKELARKMNLSVDEVQARLDARQIPYRRISDA